MTSTPPFGQRIPQVHVPSPDITEKGVADDSWEIELDAAADAQDLEDTVFDRPTMIPTVPPHMELDPMQLVSRQEALPKTVPPPSGPHIEVGETSADDLGPLLLGHGSDDAFSLDSVPPLPPPPVRFVDSLSEAPDDEDVSPPPPRSQAPTLMEDDALRFDLALPRPDTFNSKFAETQPATPSSFSSGPKTMRAPPTGGESIDHALEQLAAHGVVGDDEAPASSDMRDRFALGDYSGALHAAEAILGTAPMNPEAHRLAAECRDKLRQMYASKLGSMTGVPRVVVPPDQVRWLSLDHKAGFILSCIDGYSTIEEILDVSGMQSLDALRVLFELQQQRVIAVS